VATISSSRMNDYFDLHLLPDDQLTDATVTATEDNTTDFFLSP